MSCISKTERRLKGRLVGYTVGSGAVFIKASEIGRGLMASRLKSTWLSYHPKPVETKTAPATPSFSTIYRPVKSAGSTSTFPQSKVQSKPAEVAKTCFNINVDGKTIKAWIPDSVKDIFHKEAQVPEDNDTATIEDVGHVAMLLFLGYLDAATSMSNSCGGGGGEEPSSGWGKTEDEDERRFARRCLMMAHSMCIPKPRQRSWRR